MYVLVNSNGLQANQLDVQAARARETNQYLRYRAYGMSCDVIQLTYQAGPVMGSMLGYWILFGGWRWLFYALTIMAALNWVILATQTQETYAP
jgi:MFS family permease